MLYDSGNDNSAMPPSEIYKLNRLTGENVRADPFIPLNSLNIFYAPMPFASRLKPQNCITYLHSPTDPQQLHDSNIPAGYVQRYL